jgi:hypothetical protein
MAISLAFGVLFSTAVTLMLVPASYVILEDAAGAFHRLYGGRRRFADAGKSDFATT